MWVESEVGHGTQFHFTVAVKAVPSRGRIRFRGEQPALVGRRLLVVDDNATNRRILTLQAESWGMTAEAVATAAEALALVERGRAFDVGILDMQMPGMDGAALARAIRKHRNPAQLPLIMLSSSAAPVALDTLGLAASLTKPIKQAHLYRALAKSGADFLTIPAAFTRTTGQAHWHVLVRAREEDRTSVDRWGSGPGGVGETQHVINRWRYADESAASVVTSATTKTLMETTVEPAPDTTAVQGLCTAQCKQWGIDFGGLVQTTHRFVP